MKFKNSNVFNAKVGTEKKFLNRKEEMRVCMRRVMTMILDY
jgi:hypothetical protein